MYDIMHDGKELDSLNILSFENKKRTLDHPLSSERIRTQWNSSSHHAQFHCFLPTEVVMAASLVISTRLDRFRGGGGQYESVNMNVCPLQYKRQYTSVCQYLRIRRGGVLFILWAVNRSLAGLCCAAPRLFLGSEHSSSSEIFELRWKGRGKGKVEKCNIVSTSRTLVRDCTNASWTVTTT